MSAPEKESPMKQFSKYSVPAQAMIDAFKRCGIEYVTTVPDMVQIALHQILDGGESGLRVVHCTTEDQAIEVAGGLYAGGKKVAVIVQNQGFYAGINSLRALGLDSKVPLFFVIGQFGREFSNLGSDPRDSKRRVVFLLEPLLETLGVPSWRLEGPDDLPNIEAAWQASRDRSGPTALIVGHFVGW
ncbi:MAG: thiamine pyrophosphate-binding protein [Sulfuritalea sp.]|jgi:sulfopyruvate decarboxylase subunit alpha|nr:thiamine pyrophosphate-binding protein [Sulfuritalea sp.]